MDRFNEKLVFGRNYCSGPLGRPRHIWEDNIKMDLQEVGCGGTDWIDLAQDRVRWREILHAVLKLRVP